MKVFQRFLKSKKYRGLQIATVVFDDGSRLLLTPKPEAGEPVEAKIRNVRKGVDKHNRYLSLPR